LVSRANDWLRQAIKDLEHAKKSIKFGDYEWACFAAQQAAGKAVKALYQKLGIEIWGHSISRMLNSLPEEHKPSMELIDKAKELDRHTNKTSKFSSRRCSTRLLYNRRCKEGC